MIVAECFFLVALYCGALCSSVFVDGCWVMGDAKEHIFRVIHQGVALVQWQSLVSDCLVGLVYFLNAKWEDRFCHNFIECYVEFSLRCTERTARSLPGRFSTESTAGWRRRSTLTGRSRLVTQSSESARNIAPTVILLLGCVSVVNFLLAHGLSWHSTAPTLTLAMRLLCNFVNVYTIHYHVQHVCTRIKVRLPNGHPRENPRKENRAACRTSRWGSSCVSGSWQAERGSRWTRRHPRDDTRGEVSEVSVSVLVPWNLSFTTLRELPCDEWILWLEGKSGTLSGWFNWLKYFTRFI